MWSWVQNFRDTSVAQVLKGGVEAPAGTMTVYNFRRIRVLGIEMALIIDRLGETRALDMLVDVTKRWLALTVTGFTGEIDPRYKDLEFKGVRRLNFTHRKPPVEDKKAYAKWLSEGGNTPIYPLDFDLHFGGAVEALYILWQNRGYSQELDALVLDLQDYTAGLLELRRAFSRKFYPKKPDYTWGKALHHSFEAVYSAFRLLTLMGRTDLGEALAFYEKTLADSMSIKDGLYRTGHRVVPYYALQGSKQVAGSQDITYVNEEWGSAALLSRLGDPVYTPEMMKAMGRTVDQLVMKNGYGSEIIAARIDGGGEDSVRQITRNLSTLVLHRLYGERKGLDADLALMNEGKDAKQWQRFGASYTRFMGALSEGD